MPQASLTASQRDSACSTTLQARSRTKPGTSQVSKRPRRVVTRLMAGAVALSFFTNALVNMGMVGSVQPVAGLPLPFDLATAARRWSRWAEAREQ